jgi:DnaJ-class molecular chaperone
MSLDAFKLLGIPSSVTPTELTAWWRQLRSKTHPDKGGDAATFARLNVAYDEALAFAQQPRMCTTCAGLGHKHVSNGWGTINFRCEACNGTGKVTFT